MSDATSPHAARIASALASLDQVDPDRVPEVAPVIFAEMLNDDLTRVALTLLTLAERAMTELAVRQEAGTLPAGGRG